MGRAETARLYERGRGVAGMGLPGRCLRVAGLRPAWGLLRSGSPACDVQTRPLPTGIGSLQSPPATRCSRPCYQINPRVQPNGSAQHLDPVVDSPGLSVSMAHHPQGTNSRVVPDWLGVGKLAEQTRPCSTGTVATSAAQAVLGFDCPSSRAAAIVFSRSAISRSLRAWLVSLS